MHTIAPTSALDNITRPVIIDGYTQSGASPNTLVLGENAVLVIELSGASAGSGASGLTLGAGSSGSTICGLAIDRFSGSGISVLSDNNTVSGDFIGTNPAQGTGLGNGTGVYVSGSGNMIGGTAAAARNLIYGNTGVGVVVSGASATGDSIIGNHIYSNGGLGIDLGGDGVTANDNDTGDSDAGPNNLQNYPVLSCGQIYNNQFSVMGTFNSAPNTTYRIAVFANSATVGGDTSGYGEGQRYLGSFSVTTDGDGNATFNQVLSGASVTPGELISATATRLTAGGQFTDTSEFSNYVTAAVPAIKVNYSGLTTSEDGLQGPQVQLSITLATQPTGPVEITLSQTTPYRATLSSDAAGLHPVATLNFDSYTWNTPQIVYVTGKDDTYVEDATGPYSTAYTVTASVTSSSDGIYSTGNIPAANLSMTNTDNDLFSTIYVTTTTDNNDVNGGGLTSFSPAYLINNPGTDGAISLREAIIASNKATNVYMSGGVDVRDRIYFNIPISMGQLTTFCDGTQAYTYTINVLNLGPDTGRGLPIIASNCRVIIDATTQPIYIADGSVQPGPATRPMVALDGGTWVGGGSGGSSKAGFTISSPDVVIRGFAIGNFYRGAYNSGNADEVVQTCYIGTDITGTLQRANNTGIYFAGNNDASTIGGPLASQGCVISGNTNAGISLGGSKTGLTLIQNCYIGVNATGNVQLANGAQGIYITGRSNITITNNVISGNGTYGIDNGAASGIIITSNKIGVGADGTTARGNGNAGIWMEGSTSNNTIGGETAALGNIIANNSGDGIKISSSNAVGTVIESNRIFNNTGLGINLAPSGEAAYTVTSNDAGDGDTGPNNLQNFPVITAAATNGSTLVRISGTLNSTASRTFRIDFFANSSPDGSGYGEGQFYLGSITVPTNTSGNASFSTDLAANVHADWAISATATDLTSHSTSEFAQSNITAQCAWHHRLSGQRPEPESDGRSPQRFKNNGRRRHGPVQRGAEFRAAI